MTRELTEWLGAAEERLQALADDNRAVVDWEILDAEDGKVASIRVMMPLWPGIEAHAQAVEIARLALDLCPEVDTVEIVTLAADGERYAFSGYEPAYKRIGRQAFPRHPRTSAIPNLLEAARQLTAADYWTDRLRAQAAAFAHLHEVLEEVPQRLLHPYDNARRRKQWIDAVGRLTRDVAVMPGQPLREVDPSKPDHAAETLRQASGAMRQLVDWFDDGRAKLLGIGGQLREAVRHFERAKAAGSPRARGRG